MTRIDLQFNCAVEPYARERFVYLAIDDNYPRNLQFTPAQAEKLRHALELAIEAAEEWRKG